MVNVTVEEDGAVDIEWDSSIVVKYDIIVNGFVPITDDIGFYEREIADLFGVDILDLHIDSIDMDSDIIGTAGGGLYAEPQRVSERTTISGECIITPENDDGIDRGDTFIIDAERYRGNHYTCVGHAEDGLLAGDTNGRMWKLREYGDHGYRVYIQRGATWRSEGTIEKESVLKQ